MLPQATKIHRAITLGLEMRSKAIETDATMVKLTIEVIFDRRTREPKRVLYNSHGEDDLSES